MKKKKNWVDGQHLRQKFRLLNSYHSTVKMDYGVDADGDARILQTKWRYDSCSIKLDPVLYVLMRYCLIKLFNKIIVFKTELWTEKINLKYFCAFPFVTLCSFSCHNIFVRHNTAYGNFFSMLSK